MSAEDHSHYPFGESPWHDNEPADAEDRELTSLLTAQILEDVPFVAERFYTIGDEQTGGVVIGTSQVMGQKSLFLRGCAANNLDIEEALIHLNFDEAGRINSDVRVAGSSEADLLDSELQIEAVCTRLLELTSLHPDERSLIDLLHRAVTALISGDVLEPEDYDPTPAQGIEFLVAGRLGDAVWRSKTFEANVRDVGTVSINVDNEISGDRLTKSETCVVLSREEGGGLVYLTSPDNLPLLKSYDEDDNETVVGELTASAAAELIPALREALYDSWVNQVIVDQATGSKRLSFSEAMNKLTEAFKGYKSLARSMGNDDDTGNNAKARDLLLCIRDYMETNSHLINQPLRTRRISHLADWTVASQMLPQNPVQEHASWGMLHLQDKVNLITVCTTSAGLFLGDDSGGTQAAFRTAGEYSTKPLKFSPYYPGKNTALRFLYEDTALLAEGHPDAPIDRVIAVGYFVQTDTRLDEILVPGFIYLDNPDTGDPLIDDAVSTPGSMN